jgi:hypothetical protein
VSNRKRFAADIKRACNDYGLEAGSLLRFVEQGIRPGHFLTAVLENNFMEAARRAGEFNQLHLHDWAKVIYNDTPGGCHGSREKVDTWVKVGGLIGIDATQAEQETSG